MRGIVIAAGPGSRMGAYAEDRPKCLLPIAGRPMLEWTIENLRAAGCDELVIVAGHRAEMIRVPDARIVVNEDWRDTNILHSLMTARAYLKGPVMVTYSDIWVESSIYRRLSETPGDIVLVVDRDWQAYYQGRTCHPIPEAENVLFGDDGALADIGKHLDPAQTKGLNCGEFLGLWRMTANGARRFRDLFGELDARLAADAPLQQARHWKKAYITDIVQELVDRGEPVQCAVIERGWAELDTVQDYERLMEIAERQRLWTLCGGRPGG